MSWTTLQMASVYQALANDGELIQPRIIDSITDADGKEVPQDDPGTTQVVSPETAKTVVDMFRSTYQDDRSEEHTSELQSRFEIVCRLLLEKKKNNSTK